MRCKLCPRLVAYRETVPVRASFKHETYWRKPIPGFGDPNGRILFIGLAPAAHGGNRTGRIFTGDESGRFLFQCLYDEGLSNQPTSISRDDDLQMHDCYLTATVKCAPPQNKPTPQECVNCSQYLENEFYLLQNVQAIVALGKYAFDAVKKYAAAKGVSVKGMEFSFGASYELGSLGRLYASYHPSPQNTYTKVLTEEMFRGLLQKVKKELK